MRRKLVVGPQGPLTSPTKMMRSQRWQRLLDRMRLADGLRENTTLSQRDAVASYHPAHARYTLKRQ
jgi:hypothetical protein